MTDKPRLKTMSEAEIRKFAADVIRHALAPPYEFVPLAAADAPTVPATAGDQDGHSQFCPTTENDR